MVLVPTDRAPDDLVPFCIGETEVSVGDYRACVDAGNCTPPDPELMGEGGATWLMGDPLLPINYVLHDQAEAYCRTLGGRLPAEAEWVWAAGSAQGWPFPWGHEIVSRPHPSYCGEYAAEGVKAPIASPCRAKSFPADKTEQGAYDMAGSLGELVSANDSGKHGIAFTWAPQGLTAPESGRAERVEFVDPDPNVLHEESEMLVFVHGESATIRCAAWPR